jgi:hypothetical protein
VNINKLTFKKAMTSVLKAAQKKAGGQSGHSLIIAIIPDIANKLRTKSSFLETKLGVLAVLCE